MDLSDLSAGAIRRIAEAEIEAKHILRQSGSFSAPTGLEAELGGEQSDPESDEFSVGRNFAALHLFHATATPLWERLQPDCDAFKARLDDAKKWVANKFHPDPSVLNKAAAWERKWARREVAKNRTAPKLQQRPGGLLRAAMMRRQQALKEGRLEGYVELPSEVGMLARPEAVLVPIINVGREKRLTTIQGAAPSKSDPFATQDQREAAIKRATGKFGTVAEMATDPRDEKDVKVFDSPRTDSPAKKGGRPVILVDGEMIKELRGELTQTVFARLCKISVDALQCAENDGRSSNKTIRKIVRRLRSQGRYISAKDLIKNTPQ
jgi:DNA-binding transcriptional regulator YiaG